MKRNTDDVGVFIDKYELCTVKAANIDILFNEYQNQTNSAGVELIELIVFTLSLKDDIQLVVPAAGSKRSHDCGSLRWDQPTSYLFLLNREYI
jgi:hypothetical protein